MMPKKIIPSIFLICICLLFSQCEKEELLIDDSGVESFALGNNHNNHMKKPEGAGNCLSFPVIWSEGPTKTLRGTPGMTPEMGGAWWYQWGTNGSDPNITPASCPPDPDNPAFCDDGIEGQFDVNLVPGVPAASNPLPLSKAFLQKEEINVWQAGSADWSYAPVNVDWIDWGDNLESVDWYTKSQVRTEVVLFQDLIETMTEYGMRHTSGWGINEVHGLEATLDETPSAVEGPGTQATIYSPCARFMIQRLNVEREEINEGDLTWVPEEGWVTSDPLAEESLINAPIFNNVVYEAADGPGYYNAEVNVKGRIIYGYTWNVRRLNEGAGDYRLTFSFDTECPSIPLNTFFTEGITNIIYPAEEEILAAAAEEGEEPGGGGVAELKTDLNLTYMDIRIHERSGGGGGGGGKPSGGGGGGGGGHGGGGHN
jgi:uncharacterized membrane protein YgcG